MHYTHVFSITFCYLQGEAGPSGPPGPSGRPGHDVSILLFHGYPKLIWINIRAHSSSAFKPEASVHIYHSQCNPGDL